jgi:hypothetical protein
MANHISLYTVDRRATEWVSHPALRVFILRRRRDQVAPSTHNLDNPDPAADGIDLVVGSGRPMCMEHVLSNAFGFGGVNAGVLFRLGRELFATERAPKSADPTSARDLDRP